MPDVLGTEQLLLKPHEERRAQGVVAVGQQKVMKLLDVDDPQIRPPVNELGEVAVSRLPELQQVLSLRT